MLNLIKETIGLMIRKLPDRMLLLIKKAYYPHKLRHISERDETDFRIIKYLISPQDYVIDVGAHIGLYTKYLSDIVGIKGKVYSIEPLPFTFNILCSNIKILGLKNVKLFNCAISDENSLVDMVIPLYGSGGREFGRARVIRKDTIKSIGNIRSTVRVESRTIDSLFIRFPKISFIKIDVEGHELRCIRGALKVINKSKPALLVEISSEPMNPKSEGYKIFKLLGGMGYKSFFFDGKNLKRPVLGGNAINYLFLLPEHLKRLPISMVHI